MLIKVEAYSDYKANERPKSLIIMNKSLKIIEILDRWYGEDHDYFKVKAEDDFTYIIRYDRQGDAWELVMMEKGRQP